MGPLKLLFGRAVIIAISKSMIGEAFTERMLSVGILSIGKVHLYKI
jgi:hypothetical protein